MKKIIGVLFLINFVLISCIPTEHPVQPHERGDVATGSIEMGSLYPNQVFYSLESNSVVSSNLFMDWDIEFSCIPDTFAIKLNGARMMRVLNTHKVKFDEISANDTAGIATDSWQYDNPAGVLDSTAIGTWWEELKPNEAISKQEIYIIDRGTNERGKHTGFLKFQILGLENNTYYVRFSNLDGSNDVQIEIPINPSKNFIQLSFNDSGKVLSIEPDYNQWDLLFTRYSELLYTNDGVPTWYGVTGALINSRLVKAILDTSKPFDEITYQDVKSLQLSNKLNVIGSDWKWYDLSKGVYSVLPNKVYIIQSVNGFIYKLHFVAFYNDKGVKGYPKFDFQKL
ncbi:hypothetical protein LLG34_04885 [bacterium]|nr:hypothetical protein [bacterium]